MENEGKQSKSRSLPTRPYAIEKRVVARRYDEAICNLTSDSLIKIRGNSA
jgi:hypothetical protein